MKVPSMKTEPVGIIGGATAAIAALLYLLTSFGLDLSGDQVAAIMGIVGALGPLSAAVVARRFAWAPASVASFRTHPSNRGPDQVAVLGTADEFDHAGGV